MASSKDKPVGEVEPPEQSHSTTDHDSAGTNNSQQTPSASPGPLKRASTTPVLSAASSPKPSRESSPIRPQLKPAVSANSRTTRSRKNSQEFSPSRAPSTAGSNIPSVPSAAAIQRALSVAGTPQLLSSVSQDIKGDASKTQRPGKGLSGLAQPNGNPPRVKSPPPSVPAKTSNPPPRKAESAPTAPSIVLERATPSNRSSLDSQIEGDKDATSPGMRTPARGISGTGPTLETVQENSLPSTPITGRGLIGGSAGQGEHPARTKENPEEDASSKSKAESGSDSGGRKDTRGKDDGKNTAKPGPAANSSKPQVMHSKKSITQLLPSKAKVQEGTAKNMIVETETVSTIPQVALGGGAGERNITGRTDTGGSLRLKPSNETIRPKKEKKRAARKAPSVSAGTGVFKSRRFHHHHIYSRPPSFDESMIASPTSPMSSQFPMSYSYDPKSATLTTADIDPDLRPQWTAPLLTFPRGRTASSKADIFEAKVASAVDQTNSSDSEETFVYESNPPEPLSARPHRFHSRTPSATSMASQIDQYGARNRQDVSHSIAGKKSMKFANNSYHSFGLQDEQGTVRGPGQGGRAGNASHHHHIGRFGRNGNGHTSLFDNDSPFSNSSRQQQRVPTGHAARVSSRPTTPRSPHTSRAPGTPRKAEEALLYDLEGEGADDERAPLIGSVRTGKNRRRPYTGTLRTSYPVENKDYRLCHRITAWTSLGGLLVLVVAAIIVSLYLCSKPLLQIRVDSIQNVLASEQEIMLDLHVHAVNPNIIAVQVTDLDINIFAKSKHVGTSALWRNGRLQNTDNQSSQGPKSQEGDRFKSRHRTSLHEHYHTWDGVDEGTDPIEDPESDAQTMLLGRIFEFDSPLLFEPSPIRHLSSSSVGEVRLAKPGNKTEEGGTERWEKVILHDFELIVRGVIRYSLPISSRTRSATIGASVIVRPSDGLNKRGPLIISRPQHPYPARSNVPVRRKKG